MAVETAATMLTQWESKKIDDGVGGCGYVAGCACEYRLFVEFYTIVVLDLACVVLVLDRVKRKTKLQLATRTEEGTVWSSADNEIIRHIIDDRIPRNTFTFMNTCRVTIHSAQLDPVEPLHPPWQTA